MTNSHGVGTSIAAIVVNYNSGAHLHACLQSLLIQTRLLTKIYVVDNASTDLSLETIGNNSRSEIVRLSHNTGFAAACNHAAMLADDHDWLLLLNPDALLEPEWLEKMLEMAGKHQDCAMLACRLLLNDRHDLLDGAGDAFHVSGAHWRRGHGQMAAGQFTEPEEVFSPCAAAALYRRQVFQESGGFDETFFCYGEDVDLGFRLRMQGHYCMYVPDAIAYHAGSACSSRRSRFAIYHGHRNLVWVYFKNMPTNLLLLYLPQHLLWNLVSIVWFSLRGHGKLILRAKWDAIKALPRIIRERRKVHVKRKVRIKKLFTMMERGWLRPYMRRAHLSRQLNKLPQSKPLENHDKGNL